LSSPKCAFSVVAAKPDLNILPLYTEKQKESGDEGMKIFLDSANFSEIKEAVSWGVISGVTTNPTLMSREEASFEEMAGSICRLMGNRHVSVEALSTAAEEMVPEARRLAAMAPNIAVKIPMGVEGLKAVHELGSGEKVSCNVTLVFSVNQALLAALAGADYVSPFIGRVDDLGWDGVGLVREIVEVFDMYDLPTSVIAASIRHPRHASEVAAAGAHIATVPFAVLKQMAAHPLTDIGIERFLSDWSRFKGEKGR